MVSKLAIDAVSGLSNVTAEIRELDSSTIVETITLAENSPGVYSADSAIETRALRHVLVKAGITQVQYGYADIGADADAVTYEDRWEMSRLDSVDTTLAGLPAAVDAHVLDAADASDVVGSIVTRINNTNVNEVALVALMRDEIERGGGMLANFKSGTEFNFVFQAIKLDQIQASASSVDLDTETLVARPSPLTQTQVFAQVEAAIENVQLHEANGKLNSIQSSIDNIESATGPGSIQTIITCQAFGNPIAGVEVWVSTDEAGDNVVAGTLVSDDFGKTTFLLDAGTYYVWRDSVSHQFPSPVVLEVTDD